ncbi:GNAT family N-acetyltransferase [Flavobacterium plurextorum]|uniref:GNAT family N-acetyltransferase n=1 Tax=Flavobacterium TaxID=237 RepID=UPI00214DCFC7|nr:MULTISPECIES: GNAT family N-acetyltransferase [Flavobacterium]UUW09501.1 GNAT family N-acetyltransferase [Flavobacterium plurextorum]
MFVEVTNENIELLEDFISSMGNSNESFRYYNKRTISSVENHLVTILLIVNEIPVGYGHLDRDGDKIWLGIAISENYRGKGGGNLIMDYLMTQAYKLNLSKINLSVDRDNYPAIKLYKKFGFSQIDEVNDVLFLASNL